MGGVNLAGDVVRRPGFTFGQQQWYEIGAWRV
jgi:hypothetical protein